MDAETRNTWIGILVGQVIGSIMWAVMIFTAVACTDRPIGRLPCEVSEFSPDFTPAQREVCRQLRNQPRRDTK